MQVESVKADRCCTPALWGAVITEPQLAHVFSLLLELHDRLLVLALPRLRTARANRHHTASEFARQQRQDALILCVRRREGNDG
eukprot:4058053-Prymnesium_polylepis.2